MARTLDGTTLALGTVGALAIGATLMHRGSAALADDDYCSLCQKSKATAARTGRTFRPCYACLEKERDQYRAAAEEGLAALGRTRDRVKALVDEAKRRGGSRAIPGPYARGGGLASFNVKPGSRARAATVTLGEMAEVAIGLRDADLWLPRKGKGKGEPTRTFDADHVGIRVTRTDVLLPEYVRYALQYLAMKGLWNEQAVTVANVKAIQFQPT